MTSGPSGQPARPWLGVRRVPGRLALGVFRAPLWLYRHDKGWMLGRTFLMLVHVGRRSGQTYRTVAMVVADDRDTGEVVILSAWGPGADWLANLHAGPAREVQIGRDRFEPEHRFVDGDEAFAVGVAFRRRYPRRLRLISAILGWGDMRDDDVLRQFIRGHPLVALRPSHLL